MIRTKTISFFAAIAAAAVLSLPARVEAQQVKIGTVDMKKVFDGYYKKDTADAQIKERANDSEKVYKDMVADYQKANEEYRKLVESSNDQAVSAEERDKRKKSAETKLTEMQDIEKSVKQFQAQARTSLGDLEKRMRDAIVKEIRDVVTSKAKSGNYTLIFDTGGQSLYQTPLVLYSVAQFDITDDVLKELNANAPAPTAGAAPKSDGATGGANNTVPPVLKDTTSKPAATTAPEKPAKKK